MLLFKELFNDIFTHKRFVVMGCHNHLYESCHPRLKTRPGYEARLSLTRHQPGIQYHGDINNNNIAIIIITIIIIIINNFFWHNTLKIISKILDIVFRTKKLIKANYKPNRMKVSNYTFHKCWVKKNMHIYNYIQMQTYLHSHIG